MKKLFIPLLCLCLLLSGCGKSPSPEESPSPSGGDPSPSAEPSPSPLSPSPSPEPASPSPLPDDENPYRRGELVINQSGQASNYQVWLDFRLAVESGGDAELIVNIQTGGAALRYSAKAGNASASWSELTDTDTGEDIAGKAFFFTNTGSADHLLEIDGHAVLGFKYEAPNPSDTAQSWGKEPLESLAPFYPWQQALEDGCLVILDGKAENIGMLETFADTFGFDEGSFLRVYSEASPGGALLTDISYKDSRVVLVSGAPGSQDKTLIYDGCSLALQSSPDGAKNLVVSSGLTGEDTVILSAGQ